MTTFTGSGTRRPWGQTQETKNNQELVSSQNLNTPLFGNQTPQNSSRFATDNQVRNSGNQGKTSVFGNQEQNTNTQQSRFAFGNQEQNTNTQQSKFAFGNQEQNTNTQGRNSNTGLGNQKQVAGVFGNREQSSNQRQSAGLFGNPSQNTNNRLGNQGQSSIGNPSQNPNNRLGNQGQSSIFGNPSQNPNNRFENQGQSSQNRNNQETFGFINQGQSFNNPQMLPQGQNAAFGNQGQSFNNPQMLPQGQNAAFGNQGQSLNNPQILPQGQNAAFGNQGQSFNNPQMLPQGQNAAFGNQGQIFNNPQMSPQGQSVNNPQGQPQNFVCSNEANRIIKQQMMNALTREDWEALLLLSNSIKSWGNDAPPELLKMAEDSIRVCNSRGFTTELMYVNLLEYSQNGPTNVKLLKAKLASKKRELRKEINEDIDEMTKNAKTILQKLQESKASEEDISEFKEKFYLDKDGEEQINEIKKSSPTILRKAVRLQTTNERKMIQDLTNEVNENKTDPWTVLGLKESLYTRLLHIFGSVENFMEKYVVSNLYTIFLGTILFKFATVFICNILQTGFGAGVGVTLKGIATGLGTLYVGHVIAAVIPLILIYYITTACYGFISKSQMAHTVAGTGVLGLGTGYSLLLMMKRMLKLISWGGILWSMWSIATDLLGVIADLTINNIPSLTISGLTLCTSTYNEFVKNVFLKGVGESFRYLIYVLCQVFGTITGMGIGDTTMKLVDVCGLYAGMSAGIMAILTPDVSVLDAGDVSKIVSSGSAWEILADSLNTIWEHKWFKFDKFDNFVQFWTGWFPTKNSNGEFFIARFLFDKNPSIVRGLKDDILRQLLGLPSNAVAIR
jgi:hypothetical protein